VRSVFVVMANCAQKIGDVMVVQPVADMSSFPLGDDESQLPQDAELMGNRACLHLDGGGKLIHGQGLLQKLIEKPDPTGGSKHRHGLRDALCLFRRERRGWRGVFEGVGHT
jgi:hypothetical protein